MNITPSLVIDGILLIVLLMGAVKGYKEGFFTAAIHLMGSIGSILGGLWISSSYTQTVFDRFLREPLIKRSYSYLTQVAQNVDIPTAIGGVMGNFPRDFLRDILEKTDIDFSGIITPTQDSAALLVDNFLSPVVCAIVSVVLFLGAFIVIRLACNMLAWLFKAINSVPVIGGLNRVAGFGVGAVSGSINIILLSLLLSIIVMITGDGITFLNSRVLNGSRIVAITGLVNPFI